MNHQPRPLFVFVLSIPLFLSGIAGCRLAPLGAGQHETSPDGRYDAEATSWYDGNRQWLVLTITDVGSGKVIWEEDLGERVDNRPPFDQGIGWLDLIQWSDDSTEARFAYSFPGGQASGKEEVGEWLIVKLDEEGEVTATERVPGSRFRTVDPELIIHGDEADKTTGSEQSQGPAPPN